MYRNLRCQHHLIQERDDQRPNISGLTPVGFERWVTLLIRAYPEEEYRGSKRPFLIYQSAIRIIERRNFPRKSRGDYSHDMRTAGFMMIWNILSRNTWRSNSLKASIEKNPNLMANLRLAHSALTGRVAIYRSIVVDTFASSCRKPVVIPVRASMNHFTVVERGQRGKQTKVQRVTEIV